MLDALLLPGWYYSPAKLNQMLQNPGSSVFPPLLPSLIHVLQLSLLCWHWCISGSVGKWFRSSGKPALWTALPWCQVDASFGASERLDCSDRERQWDCPFWQQIDIRRLQCIPKLPFSAYGVLNYISAVPNSNFNYAVARDNCTSRIFNEKVQSLLRYPDNRTISCEQSLTHLDVS